MQKFLNDFIYRTHFLLIIVFLVFTFFRIYKLPTSLQFWGDVGRDFDVLYQSIQTKKPPLIGPGISFLPINQSPLYYYLYYPLFLLSGFSPYTTVLTGVWIYGIAWWLLIKYRKHFALSTGALVIIGLFVAVHPEFVRQLRPPWNPSVAFPFIMASFLLFLNLRQNYSPKQSWLFAGSLAVAIGVTYSMVPVAITLIIGLFIHYRTFPEKVLPILAKLIIAGLAVFSPLIAFEFKHGFIMSRGLFHLEVTNVLPTSIEKLAQLFTYLSGSFYYPNSVISIHLIWVVLLLNCVLIGLTKTEHIRERDRRYISSLFVLSIVIGLTLLLPFPIYSHYIFGVMSVLICTVTFLRLRFQIVLMTALLLWWLHPIQTQPYFFPTERTVQKLEQCAELICAQESQPMYLTTQAWHWYHYAGEHLFLMNKAGCKVRDITQNPGFANRMAVVADNATYIHGQTSFNELTLFGESREVTRYTCEGGIQVHVLVKSSSL